jgi:hypothetical protein
MIGWGCECSMFFSGLFCKEGILWGGKEVGTEVNVNEDLMAVGWFAEVNGVSLLGHCAYWGQKKGHV